MAEKETQGGDRKGAHQIAAEYHAMVAAGATPKAASFAIRCRIFREAGLSNPEVLVNKLDAINSLTEAKDVSTDRSAD